MKPLLFILGTAGLALTLIAQTNAPAPATSPDATEPIPAAAAPTNVPAAESLETQITSENGAKFYYYKTNTIIVYLGNVQVKNPVMTLTCGILTAHISQSNSIETLIAETNVIVDAKHKDMEINGACAKAIYTFHESNSVTNETLLMSGDTIIRKSDGSWLASDPILFDFVTGEIVATNRTTTLIVPPASLKERLKRATGGTPETKTNP